tara:strand:- start:234 stop:614 length:381 start_codon:yes stop_codon:yes gene_type:complete
MAVGGPIESIGLDGREFAVAQDAEVNRKLGGFENEVQSNGDGTARLIKTRVPLQLDGMVLVVDDDRGDHEYLQDLQDGKDFFPLTITYASGVTYGGSGQLTGETQYSNANATATANVQGPGRLRKQ